MKPLILAVAILCGAFAATSAHGAGSSKKGAPLRALLITGGCCHDYDLQAKALTKGSQKFARIDWTVVNEGGKAKSVEIPLYNDPNWAKPYDVVIHNECFADTTNPEYIRKITSAHRAGAPAVVIHCAMHTYRAATIDDWREFLGVTSRRHDHQSEYPVKVVLRDHPAMRDMPENWVTPRDELYIIEKLWPNAKALATSKSEKDGTEHPVFWTNSYKGTRVFGTTYGHGNATWQDPAFIAAVSRGLLWAAGR